MSEVDDINEVTADDSAPIAAPVQSALDRKINEHFAGWSSAQTWSRRSRATPLSLLRAGVPARPICRLRRRSHHRRWHRYRSADPGRSLRPPQPVRVGEIHDPRARTLQDHRQDHRHPQRQRRRVRSVVRQPGLRNKSSSNPPRSRPTRSCSSAASGASATSNTATATTRAPSHGFSARSSRSSCPTLTSMAMWQRVVSSPSTSGST